MNGAEDIYDGSDLEALSVLTRYRDWILSHFAPHIHGQVAEIGAGLGSFTTELAGMAETVDAVEPSANLHPALESAVAGLANVQVHRAGFEDFAAGAASASLDSIVMINVLEHIEDDERAIAACFRMLRSGGHLLIFVPALSWLFSDMDRALGHFRRYHRNGLLSLTTAAGFEVSRLSYFDVAGILPWFVINRLLGKVSFNRRLVTLYDAVVVPLVRPLESVISPPLGKNLVLIARKPS